MKDDPIIAELREIRRQIMAEFGNDLGRYLAYLQEKQKEHPERYVTVEEIEARCHAVAEEPAKYETRRSPDRSRRAP